MEGGGIGIKFSTTLSTAGSSSFINKKWYTEQKGKEFDLAIERNSVQSVPKKQTKKPPPTDWFKTVVHTAQPLWINSFLNDALLRCSGEN